MKKSPPWNIAIVGAGKVGQVLGRLLLDNGERIVAVVSRSMASAREGGRFLRCRNISTSVDSIPSSTDLVFITTPHSAIEEVAQQISMNEVLDLSRMAICHASGMLTAKALDVLAHKGAQVFSFHPLQTFPRDFRPKDIVSTAKGIYYGVDGEPRGVVTARRLARKLTGHVMLVPPDMRVFYHASCVVASNHLTTMMSIIERMFQRFNPDGNNFYPVFSPIVEATLRNVSLTSPAKSLSGPVARGGVETVAQHFSSVEELMPDVLKYFSCMTAETVRLAARKGSINEQQRHSLMEMTQLYSNKAEEVH